MSSKDTAMSVPPPTPDRAPGSQAQTAKSSAASSRNRSKPQKEKHRVQWNRGGETMDAHNNRATFQLPSDGSSEQESKEPKADSNFHNIASSLPRRRSGLHIPVGERSRSRTPSPMARHKPPLLRNSSIDPTKGAANAEKEAGDSATVERGSSVHCSNEKFDAEAIRTAAGKEYSQQSAQKRAERLSRSMGTQSAPVSRHTSPARDVRRPSRSTARVRSPPPSPPINGQQPNLDLSNIPLEKLETRRTYGIEDESEAEDNEDGNKPIRKPTKDRFQAAAKRLLKHHAQSDPRKWFKFQSTEEPGLRSGQTTPIAERDPHDYVPRPTQYREAVLGSLMKIYNEQGPASALGSLPSVYHSPRSHRHNSASNYTRDSNSSTPISTPAQSRISSPNSSGSPSPGGTTRKTKTPKWYSNPRPHSTGSLSDLNRSSHSPTRSEKSQASRYSFRPKKRHRPRSSRSLESLIGRHKRAKREEAIRIQVHLADTMQRKAYLLRICRALMSYGAPTHRLEEYMRMSARVLEIDGSFLYVPGCMIISFGDATWHTTDVRIIRCYQAVNLSKLYDTHTIYKEVIHDMIGVEEAISRLDKVTSRRNKFPKWVQVFLYGVASAFVGPFAFGARPIDLPVAFILGCVLGFMQLVLAPRSELYSNIFEISAAIITSFLARAFGSINGGTTFCFSALAQSSIALILPGYTILCGSLELQSKNIVAGSVRMVYAIIYSLFLGFGITIGASVYGAVDHHATSEITCSTRWPFWWEAIFVLPFTTCLIIINQGKWKKMPPMLFLAIAGYLVNHYSSQRFADNEQIAQTLGALAIGVMANLYSRARHGLAAALLLPAIFVQVPSGLAASGSLITGITSANEITNNAAPSNGTEAFAGEVRLGGRSGGNAAVLNVAYSMIQIAIGITVGLFMSALVVYPFGKRRSGLFSF